MWRIGMLVLAALPYIGAAQTVAQPQNLKWSIQNQGQQIPLNDRFLYVGIFDQEGLSASVLANGMAVINAHGEIIFESPRQITPLGSGCFLHNEEELLLIQNKTIQRHDFKLIKSHKHWLVGRDKFTFIAFNKKSKMRFEMSNPDVKILADYLKFEKFGTQYLCDNHGELLDSTGIMSNRDAENVSSYCSYRSFADQEFLLWFTPRLKCIITQNRVFYTPQAIRMLIHRKFIEIRESEQTHLYDFKNEQIVLSGRGDFLKPLGENLFQFSSKGKLGLMNNNGAILMAPKFDEIQLFHHYILVKSGSLYGIYDTDYKSILECKYSRIEPRYNFFFTQNGGGRGLISRKSNEEILEPIYDKILIQDNKIKAWLGTSMLALIVNEEHQVVQELKVNNMVSVDKRNLFDAKLNYDARLFELGWHFEIREGRDNNGNNHVRLAWGLKNEKDSTLAAPQFFNLKYVHHAPVVLSPVNLSSKSIYTKEYRAISNFTGKEIKDLRLVELDTLDFVYRQYGRFMDPFGHSGILMKDGTFRVFPYVDRGENKLLRVCVSAKISPASERKDSINFEPIIHWDLNGNVPYSPSLINNRYYRYYQFQNAAWNFLDANGQLIFPENFDYAFPFVGSNAIVLTQTGYGVVNDTGFVVEPVYRKITREFYNDDTLFLLESFANGATIHQLENNQLLSLSIENAVVQKNRKSVSILASAFQRHVIHKELGLIKDSLNHVKLYNDGYFVIKKNKIFHIYDPEGEELGQSNVKPKTILNDDFFTVLEKNRLALFNRYGQSMTPFKYKEIKSLNGYFFCLNGGVIDVLNDKGELLYPECEWVEFDPISEKLAYRKADKIYFSSTNKVIPMKLMLNVRPKLYFNDKLYLNNGSVYSDDGTKTEGDFGSFGQLEYLGNGMYAIEDFKQPLRIFNLGGESINLPHEKIRKPKLLTDNILEYTSEMSTFLHHLGNGTTVQIQAKIGGVSDGLLCVVLKGEGYVYLNDALENVFNYAFPRAKAFCGGKAAVRYPSGWTVIDTSGKSLLVPCLPEINVLSSDLVIVIPKNHLGLCDKFGNPIIPMGKDAIVFGENHIRTQVLGKVELVVPNMR